MNVATWNSIMNTSDIDFDNFTLADAIGYVEFEEDVNSWQDMQEEQ